MNFKVLNTLITLAVVGMSYGCQSEEFLVSEDGYQYKYITKGKGKLPKNGEVIMYNMIYKNEKDSTIFQSTGTQAALIQCDTMQWENSGPLFKAFKIIKEGDSILLKIPTTALFLESFKAPAVPQGLNPDGEITFCIGAVKIMTQQEAQAESQKMREKQQEEMLAASVGQKDKEIEVIDTYLKENNITAKSTESGLRYVIDVEGTGNYPQPGDSVMVQYTGTLLDGTKFDSSYDRPDDGPFTFLLGRRQVIQGWDEGIALLKTGGKGTLYIPSALAYGPRAKGAIIKANSILKFEVELVGIE